MNEKRPVNRPSERYLRLLDMDLFIEYRLQMPVIAGFLVMRFLSGYTLVYTVF